MRTATTILVPLIILSILSAVGFSAVISEATQAPQVLLVAWGSVQQPQNVTVGDYNVPLFVVLSGNVVGAALLPMSSQPFGTTNHIPGVIASETQTQTVVEFIVSVNSPGLFYVPMQVNYTVNGNNQIQTETVTVPVYVSPIAFPIIENIGTSDGPFLTQGSGIQSLSVTLYNPSNYLMRNIIITLDLPSGIYSLNGQQYVKIIVPQLPPYSFASGQTYVNVTNSASPGTYYITYVISYTDALGGYHSITLQNITLSVAPEQPIKATLSVTPAVPGGTSTISVVLQGQGIVNSVQLESGFTPISSNFTLPITVSGKSVLSYTVYVPQSTAPGTYPISVTVSYTSYGRTYTYTLYGYISVNLDGPVTPQVVSVNWLSFPASSGVASVSLTVFNPYSFPVYNVSVNPTNVILINEQPVPVIQPLSYGIVQLTLNLKGISGSYPMHYTITYYVDGNLYSSNSTLVINVYKYPDLELSLSPSVVFSGTQGIIDLNLTNPNQVPVYNVKVSVQSPNLQVVYQPVMIPMVNSSSSVVLPLTVMAPLNSGPGLYYLSVTTTYTYDNQEMTQQYSVPIYVSQSGGNLYLSLSPSEIYYQKVNYVVLNVTNPLKVPIYNVSLRLLYPESLVELSPSNVFIPEISPQGSYLVNLSVFPNQAMNSVLGIGVTGSYRLSNGLTYYVSTNLTVTITGLIQLEVLSPNLTYANGSVTFNGVLLNVGNAQANNVILYYEGGSQYIGQLPTGSPLYIQVPASLINGSTAKVKIVISYENGLNQVINQTYEYTGKVNIVNVTTSTLRHPNGLLTTLLIAIVVIVVIVLAIVLLRRKKG